MNAKIGKSEGMYMSQKVTPLSVQFAIKTPEVLDSLTKIVKGLEGFSLVEDKNAYRVDILVLEIGNSPETEFETISSLLQENVVETLFLTSARVTPDVLLPALRAGAKEFFQQPINKDEVVGAFDTILQKSRKNNQVGEENTRLGKIFSVLGAKGGVGTTTFAVNLAAGIQAQDKEKLVALVDMNILLGEVPLFLDLETDTDWEEIGKNLSRMDAAYLQSAMARHSSGVFVLPAPSKLDTETHLPSGFLFHLLRSMRQFFDYIIVDSGMYIDDASFKIFAESEAVYLVSILSLPCLINVRKLQESILATGGVAKDKLHIIANRFEKKAQISIVEATKVIGGDIDLTIPNNYSVAMSAINNGRTITDIAGSSDVAKVYKKLAASLVDLAIERPGGIFSWFR
jgi:pilus assembly protein CpaE